MAKIVDDTVLDAALNKIKTATRQVVCLNQPTNFASIAANNLAQVTMNTVSDYTVANGDVSGRKITMGAKSGVSVSASGLATHISLDDGVTLLYVTQCTNQSLTAGNTVNIPTWKVEIADPT
jgi:hypothetical protein